MAIRHIVLFKFKQGFGWHLDEVREAEQLTERVGQEVPEVLRWYCGRNFSSRAVAYDYVVMAELEDIGALERYLVDEFHHRAIEAWRRISDWVVADVNEETAFVHKR